MATNFAKASYTEVIDLQTVNDTTSIIAIHTPVGKAPYLKLKGFFQQFRKFKYNGISRLIMAPASALPVDPLGLTTEVGTPGQMDPRDTLNPILFKGCHGENLNNILNQIFDAKEIVQGVATGVPGGNPITRDGGDTDKASPSVRQLKINNSEGEWINYDLTKQYYRLLTDVTWKKYGIQSMVKIRNLHPLVWKLATNHPLVPSARGDAYSVNAGMYQYSYGEGENIPDTMATPDTDPYGTLAPSIASMPVGGLANAGSNRIYRQDFTNGCSRLGWLPTSTMVQGGVPQISTLPKLYMGLMVMPPSYSQEQFMRMVIRHEFSFSGFQTSCGSFDVNWNGEDLPDANYPLSGLEQTQYYNWIDYGDATSKGVTLDIVQGMSDVISDGVS